MLLALYAQLHSAGLELSFIGVPLEKGQYVAAVGEPFSLKLSVQDDRDIGGNITIAGLDKCNVLGKSSSQEIRLINGTTSSKKHFIYDVVVPREGLFTIGPATAGQGKKRVVSNKLSISARAIAPSSRTNTKQRTTEALLEASVDRTDVVIGEPIVLTLSFSCNGPVYDIQLNLPHFASFMVEQGAESQPQTLIRNGVTHDGATRDGVSWQVLTRTFVLFPLSAGEQAIGEAQARYDMPLAQNQRGDNPLASLFGRRYAQHQAASQPITVRVEPLPPAPGKVQGVGTFTQFSLTLDTQEVEVGEPVTAQLTLTGACNFSGLSAPRLMLPAGLVAYDSQNSTTRQPTLGPAGGSKTFTYLVQANNAGIYTIPSQKFTFFDTKTRAYNTLTTQATTLVVNKSGVLTPSPMPPSAPESKPQHNQHAMHSEGAQGVASAQDASRPLEGIAWQYFLLAVFAVLAIAYRERLHKLVLRIVAAWRHARGLDTPYALAREELALLKKNSDAAALHAWLRRLVARVRGIRAQAVSDEIVHEFITHIATGKQREQLLVFYMHVAELSYAEGNQKQHVQLFAEANNILSIIIEHLLSQKSLRAGEG